MGLLACWEQVLRVQLFHNRDWHKPESDTGKGLAWGTAGRAGLGELSLKGSFLCRLSGPQNQGCKGKFQSGQQHTPGCHSSALCSCHLPTFGST